MPIARFITAFQRLAGQAPEPLPDDLLPPEQFRRALERERARADRTGERLSLVTFAARCRESDAATPVLVAKILRGRLRTTDEVGWLDGRRIAVVLPNTPASGAWKVADDVCLEFCKDTPSPICTVFTYPHEWIIGAESETDAECEEELQGATRLIAPSVPLQQLLVRPVPAWKRLIDVTAAAVALVLLLPLFGLVAAAIKLTSRGPVFFGQRRSGRGGVPFRMYKFRTMVVDAEARKAALMALNEQDGPAFKVRNDPRVTRLGRFLRRTSIDELPQFINVLFGEMSLVGPRPLPCNETRACETWHRQRLDVTPGLTCIWQVRGRSQVSFADWVRMDVQYIRSRSLAQDLKLLLLTMPAVVAGKGAH
jgi:lipopolysaccharide/colanic/teichoic acid biosynthesis glycosyltransferase